MDRAAVMSEVETAIFTIITSAGEARASLYEALEKARAGQMVESQQCMSQADMQLRTAHDVQTDLITRDLNGSLPMSLLLVHAQDQLMTTMSEQSLIEQMILLIRDMEVKRGK
ncbi:PTS lactose/cellobiose transporter subunit IIA [uncultured Cutibacterium sp.]|uniref:PTS lactose/cellobiose transporter subunit IIA n=1 Tax=uncultured Cutibacterium sp. TaxID=1912223 RepID=UPI0025991D49|nr:PTS lactose/cellobiose transporter subunit IIA [uncultured Cutibacterium sp.]